MQSKPKKKSQWFKSLSAKSVERPVRPTTGKSKTDEVLGQPPLSLPVEYLEIEFPGFRQGRFHRRDDAFLIHHIR